MKTSKPIPIERRRCSECGHPNREHRSEGCTVPRCPCKIHVPTTGAAPPVSEA